MINAFIRFKTKNVCTDSAPKLNNIQQANRVLFSLFTRYGDTVISLVVIQEFVQKYADKQYLILCPRQMEPYVHELLPGIECVVLNKRNLLDMLRVDRKLKKWRPDIGFNPWSNGLDSCFFLTYCRYFLCYKDFYRPKIINHYQVVRRYLSLPEKSWHIDSENLDEYYKHVVICPQSTDPERSISNKLMKGLLYQFNSSEITIASMDKRYFHNNCNQFLFEKSAQSSLDFIDLVKRADLIVVSDSGPLHIALALDKKVQAHFYKTQVETVINTQSRLEIIDN